MGNSEDRNTHSRPQSDFAVSDANPESKGLPNEVRERLRRAVHEAGGNKAVAARVGIPISTLNDALAGTRNPRATAIAAIAQAVGRSLDWIFFGEIEAAALEQGQETSEAGVLQAGGELGPPPDAELMGRVVDTITRVAKACGASIPPIDLGRKAMERYTELMAASSDPDERLAMLKLMAVQIKAELTAPIAATEPASRKGSA